MLRVLASKIVIVQRADAATRSRTVKALQDLSDASRKQLIKDRKLEQRLILERAYSEQRLILERAYSEQRLILDRVLLGAADYLGRYRTTVRPCP